jgi:hypothetical protein
VPVSISETSYLLPNKWDWLFGAWCVLLSVPFGFYWFTVAPAGLKWMAVVTVIAILMIGVSSFYKSYHNKFEAGEEPILKQKLPNEAKDIEDEIFEISKGKPSNVVSESEQKTGGIWQKIKDLLAKFKPSEFLKYGWVRPIHYINSLVAIAMVNIYTIMTVPTYALTFTILLNVMFILIGMKVDGVYNPKFSADVNNKAWIFFMEVICFLEIFIFIW